MDCSNNSSNTTNSTSPAPYHIPDLCLYQEICDQTTWLVTGLQISTAVITFVANLFSAIILTRISTYNPVLRLALINLSITDVVGSAAYIYHITMTNIDFTSVNMECKIRYVLYVTMNVITIVTLVYLSIERFLSIALPYIHEKLDGKKFTTLALTANWIITGSYIISGMHNIIDDVPVCIYHILVPATTHFMNGLSALICIFVIVTINLGLYIHARKQILKIGQTLVGMEREERISNMETKATTTTIAVVVPFVLLNSPLYSLMLYFYTHPDFMTTCESVYLLNGFSTLLIVNSLTNPLIYVWKLTSVRAELKKCLSCLSRLSDIPSGTNGTQSSQL